MPSKFNSYTNHNILVLNAKRTKQRNERNFSLKIEKLPIFTKSSEQNYSLLSDKSLVNEGSSFTITLNTENVANETNVPYTISGIQPGDIGGVSLTGGSFTVNNNTATATFNVTEDFTIDGEETFTLTLNKIGTSVSVTIEDTSTPTYDLTSSTSSVNEGDNFTITLNTQGLSNGTVVPYSIEGVEPADINDASLTGDFTINNNTATATFNVTTDQLTEGNETLTLSLDNNADSISITIEDTSTTPTYELTRSQSSVNEGDNFTITLNTQGLSNGTVVPYTISGIQPGDIGGVSLTGDFTINNNTATATFNVTTDQLTEGNETLTLSLDNNADSINVTINDTSTTPTYELTRSQSSVNEGDNFTITLNTQGLSNGTVVPYTISGIQPGDIGGVSLTGDFTINNNTATATFNVTTDQLTEGNETLTLSLDNNADSINVTINDTSTTPTYELTRSQSSVNEGDNFTITLNTQGLSNGTVVPYTISGIQPGDIGGVSLTGDFTINNNTATATFNVTTDQLTEGNETLTLSLDNNADSINVTINDTSTTPTYELTRSQSSVNEGDNFTITLNTQGLSNGTVVPYTISGVEPADINNASLTGDFTINNNTATATFNVTTDQLTEGNETLTLSLDNNADSISITIEDTSTTPTYELTSSTSSVIGGGNFTITLNTQGVFDGVTVPYTISGVEPAVINNASLTGDFTINNNTATATFNVTADQLTEDNETLTLSLGNNADSINVTIVGIANPTTQIYALTLDNESVAPPPIVERYALTLDNESVTPPPIVERYALTLDNESVTPPPIVERYALTLDNESVAPPIGQRYALTLDNESVAPPIVERYALTLDNESVAPPIIVERYALTLDNESVAPPAA
jgi:hypothetical protein